MYLYKALNIMSNWSEWACGIVTQTGLLESELITALGWYWSCLRTTQAEVHVVVYLEVSFQTKSS